MTNSWQLYIRSDSEIEKVHFFLIIKWSWGRGCGSQPDTAGLPQYWDITATIVATVRTGRSKNEIRNESVWVFCVRSSSRNRTGIFVGLHAFKAQWSLYVPHSCHYMYRTVVTTCTAQWSLYIPHSGNYMYRTVVTICTAQRSLYVPHSGHYVYRTVVNISTTSLTFNNSTFCPRSVFMCSVWIWEQTAIISLYNINWLVCITDGECLLRCTDSYIYIYIYIHSSF